MSPVDIEAAIVACLTAGVPAEVDVATAVDSDVESPGETASYIRVTALGGDPRTLIQSVPRALIECFAPSETAALDLARLAYGLLWAAQNSWLDDETWVSSIGLTDPVNFPDPDTKSARYQFIASPIASLVA